MTKKIRVCAVKKTFFIGIFIAASCVGSLSSAQQNRPTECQKNTGWGKLTVEYNKQCNESTHTGKVQLTLNKKFWPKKIRSWSPQHMWVKLKGFFRPKNEQKILNKVAGQVTLGAEFDETIWPTKLGNLRPIKSVMKLKSLQQTLRYLVHGKQVIQKAFASLTFGERTFPAWFGRFRPSSTTVESYTYLENRYKSEKPLSEQLTTWVTLKSFFTHKLWPAWMGKMRPTETTLRGEMRPKSPLNNSQGNPRLGASISYTQDIWPSWLKWLRPSTTTLDVSMPINPDLPVKDLGYSLKNVKTEATINYDKKQLPACLSKTRPDIQLQLKVEKKGKSFNSLSAQCKFSLTRCLATLKMAINASKEVSFGLSVSNDTVLGK